MKGSKSRTIDDGKVRKGVMPIRLTAPISLSIVVVRIAFDLRDYRLQRGRAAGKRNHQKAYLLFCVRPLLFVVVIGLGDRQ